MFQISELKSGDKTVSVIGLGYVGIPLAVAFSKHFKVIGFDLNQEKVGLYQKGIDPTHEVGNDAIKEADMIYTTNEKDLKEAHFHIVAVPTPINPDKTPDMTPLKGASEILGRNITKGSVIVFESTVYPGVTEEYCVPIIEKLSGLTCGVDFKIGYSPERINPGDQQHRLNTIVKVVSGMDAETLELIAEVYETIIDAGVHRASSIKVAEAAKVIENSQRDINIAFVNELAIIFDRMGIDTKEVLEAAGTKWNFLKFQPGLVGGHCIGVDPYYLTYKSEMLGYRPEVILAGRRINDNMGKFIAEKTVKKMIEANVNIKNSRVLIMGLTFKEDCPDLRNSKVQDVINELKEYGVEILVTDPIANPDEAFHEYGVELIHLGEVSQVDAIVICVAHQVYKQLTVDQLTALYKPLHEHKVFVDIKSVFNRDIFEDAFEYWRL